MAREEKSYEIMKENFKNNKVFLTPDIVTILNETNSNESKREGALIILRNDEETKVSKKINNDIEEILKMYFTKVERSDTAQGGSIMEHKKREKLNDMFDMYRSSELVVTDRLHGMIFAAITETPCIAFDNYNHKIKYTSRWFKHCEYIKYIENHEDLEQLKKDILILKQIKDRKYDNKFAIDIFDDVMQEIMQTI